MELIKPTPEVARVGLRALKAIAMADGTFHDLERALLESGQRYVLETKFDLDKLEPITPKELAEGIPEPLREQLINACIVCALIDGEASTSEAEQLYKFSTALGIESRALTDLEHLIDRHLITLRIDILRRSFVGQRMSGFVGDRGVRAAFSLIQSMLNLEQPRLAEKYLELEDKPPGTLGRGYYEFIRANQFSFPGEKGGPPEPIVFHDCVHVLTGYGTSSLEETQIASFQAGMMKKDPIFGMFFTLAQFQLGVQITPTTDGEKLVVDPDLMLKAFVRGTKTTRDLCTNWEPWDDFDRPIAELQSEYNIAPRSR